MNILFDSRKEQFKKPFGCLVESETVTVNLYSKDAGETGVLFLLEKDGEDVVPYPMKKTATENGYDVYSASVTVGDRGLYFYCFKILWENGEQFIYRDGYNRPVCGEGRRWQLTCYSDEYQPPESFYGGVMYQIFPDRFNRKGLCETKDKLTPYHIHENLEDVPVFLPDSEGTVWNNDFYGGNFAGMMEKLPYLQALGVNIIYLNPIFKAFSNHRYDTADYMQVDPLLGTNEDFKTFCDEAHKLGIRVILDGVFSHTGSDSVYFDVNNRFGGGAYHDWHSPYREWYQFEEYPHKYTSWWGIKTLPCVDENNASYQDYIIENENSVIRYWLRQGADGWRLDVADELPDGFLYKLYQVTKEEKPESLVIGEVWEDASNKISYGNRRHYLQGGCLDGVMNYVWRNAIIAFVRGEMSAEDFCESVMTLCEHYPAVALHSMMNILSTHDTPRILTALGIDNVPASREERASYRLSAAERKRAKNRLISASFLQFVLPGCPNIYYGDEIGLEGFEDPFNRRYMGNAQGDAEIFDCYRALSNMKNEHKALQQGRVEPMFAGKGIFAFYRICDEEKILCIVNTAETPYSLTLTGETVLYSANAMAEEQEILLLPYGCACLQK